MGDSKDWTAIALQMMAIGAVLRAFGKPVPERTAHLAALLVTTADPPVGLTPARERDYYALPNCPRELPASSWGDALRRLRWSGALLESDGFETWSLGVWDPVYTAEWADLRARFVVDTHPLWGPHFEFRRPREPR